MRGGEGRCAEKAGKKKMQREEKRTCLTGRYEMCPACSQTCDRDLGKEAFKGGEGGPEERRGEQSGKGVYGEKWGHIKK